METMARCIGGERACPPEDCGGVRGFYDFLDALEDPHRPGHEDKWEWNGGPFAETAFSEDAVNRWFAPRPGKKPAAKKKRARQAGSGSNTSSVVIAIAGDKVR